MRPTPLRLLKEILVLSSKSKLQLITGRRNEIISDEKFIEKVIGGFSFARWGDGETAILRSKNIGYQASSKLLREKLRTLIEIEDSTLIVGVPWCYSASIIDGRWTRKTLKVMFSTRVLLYKYLIKRNRSLGRTEFFWSLGGKLKTLLDSICQGKSTLLVASDISFLDLCPRGTSFLQAPKTDAFSRYDEISLGIDKWILDNENKGKVILCSIGPTSKAIVLDFFRKAQVLDIGHGFRFSKYGEGKWAWISE